jgi:phosphinothricin acetyltransferase
MMLRDAVDADLPGILAIYNYAVLNSTAIWNDTPTDLSGRLGWLRDRQAKAYPVIIAEEAGEVLGYASFGDFRPFEGFRISVEHSVYVAAHAQGRGLGRRLVEALFEPARALGKKVMIGGITAGNEASLALHAKLGFVQSAYMAGIGIKFGQRLDLVFVQKEL